VRTKADLVDSDMQRLLQNENALVVSTRTGLGMDKLLEILAKEADALGGEPALVTHARQRHALGEAVERLEAAIACAVPGREEIVAEELRLAARALGRITGRVGVEDVLDHIFKNFCIGK
jgi:tRNA modification GTPase